MTAFGFIENDKLDVGDIRHQGGFGFADNPCNAGFRPRILNGSDDGERVARVADRRKANDTYFFRLRY